MRWIWALAIACVVAATGVRPEQELRADHSGQIDRAPSSPLQHLTARSHAPQPLAKPLALVPPSPRVPTPPRTRAVASQWSLHPSSSQLAPTHSARGPPIG